MLFKKLVNKLDAILSRWGVGRKWIKGESKSPYKYQDSESLRIDFRVSFEKSTETGDVSPRGFNSFSNLSP